MPYIRNCILYYKNQPECITFTEKIKDFLLISGKVNRIYMLPADTPIFSSKEVEQDNTLVIVLGGDGTFLSASRWLGDSDIPIVGINLGGLGFLTEISKENCFEELSHILKGNFIMEERLKLEVSIKEKEEILFRQTVLNDVVINKGTLARIIDLQVYIDGKYLTHYRADGLIVSTPTGSTAYNISAGGPIICPTARVIVVTPICSFNLTDRPIVIPTPFKMDILPESPDQEIYLTCDGQVGRHIYPGNIITVSVSPIPLKFVKPLSIDYFEILRTKLKWGRNRKKLLQSP